MVEKNNVVIQEITELVNQVKNNLANEINKSVIYVYWNIGRIIVSNENEHNNRMEYGKEVLKGLSNELTKYLGIILCAEKDNIMMEFAFGGLSSNIFASTYTYYIPNKEQLISEVEKVLREEDK